MICDVMPTISEDSSSQGDRDSQISGECANVEEMLLSMLDERDRLMEGLREVQEQLIVSQGKLEECEKEKVSLQKQMADTMPQEVAALTREVNQLRQTLEQKEEEITDLKAERNNTRLLLEHLECLVSRHERSLRMTVVKRQVVNPAGVSSEVEVLKALKSLFEHHKALDEKVRERLKVAVDKSVQLEEEILRLSSELEKFKKICATANGGESNAKKVEVNDLIPIISPAMQTSDYVNVPYNMTNNIPDNVGISSSYSSSLGYLSSGKHSNSYNDLIKLERATAAITQQQISALQDLIDKQSSELLLVRKDIIEKTTKVRELEDTLSNATMDLKKTLEQLDAIKHQLHESEAKRDDQEERISTLEKRYQTGQKDITMALEESDKAKSELAMKDTELKHMEDKNHQIKIRLDQTEAQLIRSKSCFNAGMESELTSAAATMAQKRRPGNVAIQLAEDEDIDNQTIRSSLKKKGNAFAANELMVTIAEDKIVQLESRIAEAEGELCRAAQRDKLNEEHNNRLTGTVSKLLAESNERLQCHLHEKMRNLKEKNDLNCELDRIRRLLEATKSERDTLLNQTQWLKEQIVEMSETTINMRQQIESLRTSLIIARENAEAEKLYSASLPRGIGNMCDTSNRQYFPPSHHPYGHNDDNWVQGQTKPINEEEEMNPFVDQYHDNIDGLEIHPNTQSANRDDVLSSPNGTSDAKALALMIQEQLDAINNEIRLIQEEKETTEQRADELESRVGSCTNLGMVGSWSPPPINGKSSPGGPPTNWKHQINSSRHLVRQGLGKIQENFPTPSWLVCQNTHPADDHDVSMTKYNSERPIQLDNLPEDESDNDNLKRLENVLLEEDIERLHVEPRHIRCESSPPTTPRLNRAPILVSSSPSAPPINQGCSDRNHKFSHLPIAPSPQSSPSSGSQDSLHNPGVCGGTQRTDSVNNAERKKSRLSSTLSRIFKKDRGKDHCYSGRLEIGSPVPSAVTQMTNFQSIYRHPVETNIRPTSASLPHQFSHNQYNLNQINNHGTMQPRIGLANNIRNVNHNAKELIVGGSSTMPLGKQTEEKRRKKKEELLDEAMRAKTPFTFWNGPTVVAWLELWVKMPAWYVAACRANVKSGSVMAALSDQEIQREIGISNPLHRLKLRLAIQEMVAVTNGATGTKMTVTPLVFGDMDHEWIGQHWLPSLDLGQYKSSFMENLVDARMLEHLTKRDLRNQLKILDSFHRSSLQYGISLLRRISYNRQELERRRNACHTGNVDVVVWTNDRVVRWLNSIGLKEFTGNLKENGLHGAMLTLDNDLDTNAIALMLQIPSQSTQLRARLDRELALLLQPYRSIAILTSNDHLESTNYDPQKMLEYPSDDECDTERDSPS